MTPKEEFGAKLRRVREWMERSGATGVLLQKQTNLAWLLCGAETFIARTVERGSASVVVTAVGCHVLANCIEGPRLCSEELGEVNVEVHEFPWHEDATDALIRELAGSAGASDTGSAGTRPEEPALIGLQTPLTPAEVVRYRTLGADCGAALGEAMRAVRPGMSEHEIAARIALEVLARGVQVAVLLVAADDRALRYRHPIPTGRKVARYVMGVLVGRRWGLHASCTRCVHFGALPDDLAAKHRSVCAVDAAMLHATRPGATGADVFAAATTAYDRTGYPDEWLRHHQGGASGYQSRTWRATPGGRETISADQAFAWNPSIAGTKSEDTVLCTEAAPEVLTVTPEWPATAVEVEGMVLRRPDILVL